jgi:hypothetical protein
MVLKIDIKSDGYKWLKIDNYKCFKMMLKLIFTYTVFKNII